MSKKVVLQFVAGGIGGFVGFALVAIVSALAMQQSMGLGILLILLDLGVLYISVLPDADANVTVQLHLDKMEAFWLGLRVGPWLSFIVVIALLIHAV